MLWLNTFRLRYALQESQLVLGTKMYQAGLGDGQLLDQIVELTKRIEVPGPNTSVRRQLMDFRRRLTVRMAEAALSAAACPTGLEAEYRAATAAADSVRRNSDLACRRADLLGVNDQTTRRWLFAAAIGLFVCACGFAFMLASRPNTSISAEQLAIDQSSLVSPQGDVSITADRARAVPAAVDGKENGDLPAEQNEPRSLEHIPISLDTANVDPLVALLFGDVQFNYDEYGYQNVQLGTSFNEINTNTPLTNDARSLPNKYRREDNEAYREEFIFDDSKQLVFYSRTYNSGPDEYLDRLVEVFGKTTKEIKEITRTGNNFLVRNTAVPYTFPRTLVQILFFKSVSGGGLSENLPQPNVPKFSRVPVKTTETTAVAIASKAWVTGLLNESVQKKRENVKWLRQTADAITNGTIDIKKIPPIEGALIEFAAGKGSKEINVIDTQRQAFKEKAGQKAKEFSCMLASVGTTQNRAGEGLVISFFFNRYSPNTSRSLLQNQDGVELNAADVLRYNGRNKLSFTLFEMFVIDLNSFLLQVAFPPKSDHVQLITPSYLTGMPPYYEWHTADGWKVSCGFDESVTLEQVEEVKL